MRWKNIKRNTKNHTILIKRLWKIAFRSNFVSFFFTSLFIHKELCISLEIQFKYVDNIFNYPWCYIIRINRAISWLFEVSDVGRDAVFGAIWTVGWFLMGIWVFWRVLVFLDENRVFFGPEIKYWHLNLPSRTSFIV